MNYRQITIKTSKSFPQRLYMTDNRGWLDIEGDLFSFGIKETFCVSYFEEYSSKSFFLTRSQHNCQRRIY